MWKENNNKLEKTFELKDFREAINFIELIAIAAEEMDHHPEIYNLYNKVGIKLSTHSAGDLVTARDKKLSAIIEELYNSHYNKTGTTQDNKEIDNSLW